MMRSPVFQLFEVVRGKLQAGPLRVAFAVWLVVLVQCDQALGADAVDPGQIAAQRQQFTLAERPADAQGVLDLRRKLDSAKRPDGSAKLDEVVVTGQIGGLPNPWGDTHPEFPWYADQASFFLVDTEVAAQFAKHAKEHGGDVDCPFCRRLATKNVNAIAVVNLMDEQDRIPKVDARQLLDLKPGQVVVVRGTADLLGGSFVVINAKGIFVSE
jgi:hypothetical protein